MDNNDMALPDGPRCQPTASAANASSQSGITNAWECFADRSYFDMWCVRQVGERDFRRSFHLVNADEAQGLCDLLNAERVNP